MITLLIIIFLISSPLYAGGKNPEVISERNYIMYSIDNNSWTTLSGTTNVNSFECLSGNIKSNGIVLTEFFSGSDMISFSDASLIMDVSSFDCRNPLITRDMARAIGGGENSSINITLLDAEMKEGSFYSSTGNFKASAIITLNNMSNTVELSIDWSRSDAMEFQFEGSAELSMSDFGISPPSPALGIVKVDDKITVRFNYIIQPGIISSLD